MGILHLLLKVDTGEYYDLGKSLGQSCFPEGRLFILRDIFHTPTDLAKQFEKEIEGGFWSLKGKDATIYAHKVADNLWEWAEQERLFKTTDTDDYFVDASLLNLVSKTVRFNQGKFTETGSRYI